MIWLFLFSLVLADECAIFCLEKLALTRCESSYCSNETCTEIVWADPYSTDVLFGTPDRSNRVACNIARLFLYSARNFSGDLDGSIEIEGVVDDLIFRISDFEKGIQLSPELFALFTAKVESQNVMLSPKPGEMDCAAARNIEDWPNIILFFREREEIFILTCDHYLVFTKEGTCYSLVSEATDTVVEISRSLIDQIVALKYLQ